MKSVLRALALLACCGGIAAQEIAPKPATDDASGNPEIEGFVSVCATAVAQRASAYRGLLDKPLDCGAHLAKGPLIGRSSEEYGQRFDKAARLIVRESERDAQGVRGACERLAFACIERHPSLSRGEKATALRAIAVEGHD